MLLTCSQMRALEESAFADGITEEALMEEAGLLIANAVMQFFPVPGDCIVAAGKGHNGGDGFVAARHLERAGWIIQVQAAFPRDEWAELTRRQFERLGSNSVEGGKGCQPASAPLVILDALLGIGATGAVRDPIRAACREINRLCREENAHVFAIDIPTGLDGDSGEADANAVMADTTLTIGFAKNGLMSDSAINHVGRIAVLPLHELSARVSRQQWAESACVATAAELAPLLPRRSFDTHKGQCGRVGIIAGSPGFLGAAILSAEGAVRGGAGLVTLFVPEEIYPVIAARIAPEVMVRAVSTLTCVLEEKLDVVAIGPGLGKSRGAEVLELIERLPQPTVVDADALNILATEISALGRCVGPRLLTPHPGEMARLDPSSASRTRSATVETFTAQWPHTLLLKGARTIVGQREKPLSYNATGHPGLATGGVGDVLTGLLAALAGQGLELYDAARVGFWLIGRAAEVAIFSGVESAETLRPTAILEQLGRAFSDLRSECF